MGLRPVTAADAPRADSLAGLRSSPDVQRAAAHAIVRARTETLGRARYLARQAAALRAGAPVFATD